jgi:hypothetical protein
MSSRRSWRRRRSTAANRRRGMGVDTVGPPGCRLPHPRHPIGKALTVRRTIGSPYVSTEKPDSLPGHREPLHPSDLGTQGLHGQPHRRPGRRVAAADGGVRRPPVRALRTAPWTSHHGGLPDTVVREWLYSGCWRLPCQERARNEPGGRTWSSRMKGSLAPTEQLRPGGADRGECGGTPSPSGSPAPS